MRNGLLIATSMAIMLGACSSEPMAPIEDVVVVGNYTARYTDGRILRLALYEGGTVTAIEQGVRADGFLGNDATRLHGHFSVSGDRVRIQVDAFLFDGKATPDGSAFAGTLEYDADRWSVGFERVSERPQL